MESKGSLLIKRDWPTRRLVAYLPDGSSLHEDESGYSFVDLVADQTPLPIKVIRKALNVIRFDKEIRHFFFNLSESEA